MIDKLIKSTEIHLPLIIKDVIWDEDNLCICGDNWSFNTMSPFRIITDNTLFGNADKEIKSILSQIKGEKIIKLVPFGGNKKLDFSFEVENGYIIEFFSNSYFEPWVFKIEDEITYVPSY